MFAARGCVELTKEHSNIGTKRLSNIELLRIISMLLIITTHFWGHGIDLASIEPFTLPYYFGWFVKGISYVSVNTYVLISAYFLCRSKFQVNKLLILWFEIEFYSVSLYVLAVFSNTVHFSLKGVLTALFPVCTGEYWFVTIYIGLFLLHPILDFFIAAMNRRQHGVTVAILILLFVVIPNVFFFSKWLNFGTGYGIVWFVVLYFIGSYLRLYVTKEWIKKNATKIRILSVVFLLLPGISRIVIAFTTRLILGHVVGAGLFFSNNSIIIVPATILFFLTFLTFDIKNKKIEKVINKLSSGSFAVYLIHDNPNISTKMWSILAEGIHLYDMRLVIEFLGVIIGIYVACVIIDAIRRQLFKIVNNISVGNKIDIFINKVFNIQ